MELNKHYFLSLQSLIFMMWFDMGTHSTLKTCMGLVFLVFFVYSEYKIWKSWNNKTNKE